MAVVLEGEIEVAASSPRWPLVLVRPLPVNRIAVLVDHGARRCGRFVLPALAAAGALQLVTGR